MKAALSVVLEEQHPDPVARVAELMRQHATPQVRRPDSRSFGPPTLVSSLAQAVDSKASKATAVKEKVLSLLEAARVRGAELRAAAAGKRGPTVVVLTGGPGVGKRVEAPSN